MESQRKLQQGIGAFLEYKSKVVTLQKTYSAAEGGTDDMCKLVLSE
jgi:hypothetical protein